jgi:hypothetical protein
VRVVRRILRDLALTFYDDFEFKCISLPRVWCAVSGLCIVIAWIGEQFFDHKFAGWTQLVSWATACLGAYGVKKWTEKGGNNNAG